MKLPPCPPVASLVALIISLIGCFGYCFLFNRAVDGFSTQLDTLLSIGRIHMILFLHLVALFFTLFVVFFYVVGVVTTKTVNGKLNSATNCCCRWLSFLLGNQLAMAIITVTSYGLVIAWALLLCFTAIMMGLYIIFIGATYSFCALIDNQCFDFTVLMPAIINMVTHKNVDVTFCQEKKEALCSAKYNFSGTFVLAFIMCLIALIGLVHFLMCMVANFTRLRQHQMRSKGHDYETDGAGGNSMAMNVRMTKDDI
uniref:Uncharacterized protein n=1 Tax=Plectus sambesii TaxID=2011161 RepID=A0A914VIN8_9BILA